MTAELSRIVAIVGVPATMSLVAYLGSRTISMLARMNETMIRHDGRLDHLEETEREHHRENRATIARLETLIDALR